MRLRAVFSYLFMCLLTIITCIYSHMLAASKLKVRTDVVS